MELLLTYVLALVAMLVALVVYEAGFAVAAVLNGGRLYEVSVSVVRVWQDGGRWRVQGRSWRCWCSGYVFFAPSRSAIEPLRRHIRRVVLAGLAAELLLFSLCLVAGAALLDASSRMATPVFLLAFAALTVGC